jgi:hypothetical protein
MSWLSVILKVQSIRDQLRTELPHVVPLLEAMQANDYTKASQEFMAFGEVQEFLNTLDAKADALAEDLLSRVPAEMQSAVREAMGDVGAKIKEEITGAIPILLQGLDSVIPEESLLKLFAAAGVT